MNLINTLKDKFIIEAFDNLNKIRLTGIFLDDIVNRLDHLEITKQDIRPFLHNIREKDKGSENLAVFTSALIQKSYENGDNNFSLDFTRFENNMHCVGYCLKGTEQRILRLTVKGDIGTGAGMYSKHTHLTFNGKVRSHAGSNSSYSTYIFNDSVKDYTGETAKFCEFKFHGKTGEDTGRFANNSKFYCTKIADAWKIKKNCMDTCKIYIIGG